MSQNNEMAAALAALLNPADDKKAAAGTKEKPAPSILWLNIGVNVPGKDGEEPTFVSLPFGLPLDDMKPSKISGNNADWHKLVAAKNALLAALQAKGAAFEPGHAEVLPGLQVQLLRKNDGSKAGPDEENSLIAGMASLLGG